MPYVINNSSGTKLFYVGDQSFNNETAVSLPGRNVPDYGEVVDTNFIHMLENFANDTPPQTTSTLTGQLWYDTSNGIFKVYDGNKWVQHNKIPVSEGAPGGTNTQGTMYYDETIRKLKVFYDSAWIDSSYSGEISTAYNAIGQGSPTLYGTRIRNIFLKRQSDDRDVPVLAIVHSYNGDTGIDIPVGTVSTLYGSETLIGIISRVPEFTVKDTSTNSEEENLNWYDELNETGGIGIVIRPGLNVRKDATAEYPIASLSQRSQTSYNLNLGSYGADGANIEAANVFRHDSHSLPVSTLTYDLGGPSNVFAELWVNDIWLSNSLLANGNGNVSIGTDNNPIDNIFVSNIEIDGSLKIEGDNVALGAPDAPIDKLYVNSAYVYESLSVGDVDNLTNFVLPSDRSGNSRLVCDDDGQVYWLDNGGLYTNLSAEQGINIFTSVEPYGPAGNISNRTASIGVKLGNGLAFDGNGNIEVNAADLTSDDIAEGNTNLYFSDLRVASFISNAITPSDSTGIELSVTPIFGSSEYNYSMGLTGGASAVVGTIVGSSESPLTIFQNRENVDENGYNLVEIDLQLGPLQGADGVTGIIAGSGIKNTTGEIGLDWSPVADNLFTTDISKSSEASASYAGEIGIARIDNFETGGSPGSHVIYLKSINSLGGGSSLDSIMHTNKVNQMTNNSGAIKFGSEWQAGYSSAGHNSQGTIRHLGNVRLITENSTQNGSLIADGDVTARNLSQSSDQRLKKNISTIDHGLDKVKALRGVNYTLLRDSTDQVGLIAQEVEQIVPEVVSQDLEGMKSVNYGALVGVLIEAVKELSQKVEDLESKLGD
jgi:hypothetical protein